MKKLFVVTFMSLVSIFTSASFVPPIQNVVGLHFSIGIMHPVGAKHEIHRTPPVAPVIFIDMETGILYSDGPLYDCTVNLVSESGEVEFTSVVPDGAEEIQLPTMAPGVYELQIVRGDYIFYCEIEF